MAKPAKKLKKSSSTKKDDSSLIELASNITAIVKADSPILTNALEKEDGFTSEEYSEGIIQPEIRPEIYFSLAEQNNSLGQCISVMEVNCDATGYTVIRSDKEDLTDDDNKEIDNINDFFSEVYPLKSLTTIRRAIRRNLEICGCGYLEVMRNPKGEIVFLKDIEAQGMRLKKLGPAVISKKTMIRGGAEVSFSVPTRDRIFVQKVNEKKVYFKEFGSSRDLDKDTGKWAEQGQKLPFEKRASEVIYFRVNPASNSSYGLPRWIGQLPSVLGSRRAEELNLEYFDSGGIPPVLVFVSGGAMAEEAKKSLQALLTGKAKDKLRGLVADIHSTGGSVDKESSVKVNVETFESAKQDDSMFENYDERCERRVRSSWRIPPLFVGKAEDYSYASVFASYTVAEAQVFKPERDEFDEIFNATIMKELTKGRYRIKSNPLTVANGENKLEAIDLAANKGVLTKNQLIEELNSSSGLSIPLLAKDEDLTPALPPSNGKNPVNGNEDGDTGTGGVPAGAGVGVSKTDLSYLGVIADGNVKSLMGTLDDNDKRVLIKDMESLNDYEKNVVLMITAAKVYGSTSNDPAGMAELCGCVGDF